MTIAELNRKLNSLQKINKAKAQETATQNYILAILIGRSIASYFSNDIEMPPIEQAYPSLFSEAAEDTKQKKDEVKAELSALRFKQFAQSFNQRFKK
jgi:hypothetical protein